MILSVPTKPSMMHAPDGFFAVWISLLGWLLMAAIIAISIRNTREQLGERQIPLMGVLAATIFAGQMLNFPVLGGTSGHLLGGALAAIIVGPWAGVLIISSVVMIQALLFQDGGLLALGLNVINMGVITAFVGYFVFQAVKKLSRGRGGLLAASFLAGWVSIVVTAAFVSVELALSGTVALQVALPAMLGIHAMIGVGEGLLTAFALGFLLSTRGDLVTGETAPGQRSAGWITVGLLLAIGLTLLAPLASPYSDGLERVAEVLGAPDEVAVKPVGIQVPESRQFFGQPQASPFEILPDYTLPFLGATPLSTILAGGIGVLLVFGLSYGAARVARRRSPPGKEIASIEG